MPLIKAKLAIGRLKPELPAIVRLIDERDRITGRVALPTELQTVLIAEQSGPSGTKGARGPALYFDEDAVNALVAELQAQRARRRAQQEAPAVAANALARVAHTIPNPVARRSLLRIAGRMTA